MVHPRKLPRASAVARTGLVALIMGTLGAGTAFAQSPAGGVDPAVLDTITMPAPHDASFAAATCKEKNEVVYGKLSGDGAVNNVYVVNIFEGLSGGSYTDYGAYETVRNLTDATPLTVGQDAVSFAPSSESFSYEGQLSNQSLPWNISLNYSLDGQNIAASELGGASGSLGLTIDTAPNEAVNATYFDNYLVQISLTLPSDVVSDLNTSGGQVARAGSDYTVTFMAMPESPSHFSLAATVDDFEMSAISFAAVPLSFLLESPDTSELTDGFNALGDGVDELAEGAQSLADGTGRLASGMDELSSGASSLSSGFNELSQGTAQSAAGARSLAGGIEQLSQGLLSNAQQALSAAEALRSQMPNGSSFDTSAFNTAVADFASAYSAAYAEYFAGAFAQAYAGAVSSGADPQTALQGATQQASELAARNTMADSRVSGALNSMGGAVQSLVEQATRETSTLAGEIGGYEGSARALQETAANLEGLIEGANELASGSEALAAGTSMLAQGADELAQGAQQTASGVHELASGSSTLADGTNRLSSEVRTMPDETQKQIDDMLASYDRSDYVPPSFTNARNGNVALVQFVLSTDPITAPEEDVVEEEEPEPSIIDRFLDLFR